MRAVLFPLLDLFADELEADGRFEHGDAEIIADRLCHARRNEGLDDGGVLGQRVLLLEAGEDIVEQQNAHLIARKRDELALVVLDGDAEAVGVGVGAEHDVRLDLVRKVDAHRERLLEFGVGHLDGRKLGILDGLFLDDGHVDAQLLQNGHDGHIAAAVDGGIDELQILPALFDRLFGEGELGKFLNVRLVHFLGDALYKRALVVPRDGEIIFDLLDVLDDDGGRLGGHLRAVLAVHLIAVVFLGVVRRRDHDARDGL